MFHFDVPAGWQALANPWWLPINFLLIAGILALGWWAYRRPAYGVAGIAISLPLYLARARFGWLPTTYLELAILTVVCAWLIHDIRTATGWQYAPDPLRGPALTLLAAGTLALLWSPNLPAAAGLWKAYLVEPMLVYALARRALQTDADRRIAAVALAISGAGVAIAALWQWFTGVGIAEASWVPPPHRRVTAWYTSPNAVGLFLGPILALVAGWLTSQHLRIRHRLAGIAFLGLGLAAVWTTKSAGTWLALAAAAFTLGWFTLGRIRTTAITAVTLGVLLLVPASRARISAQFNDAAAQNRIALWRGTARYLETSPRHFLLGAGIYGFPQVHQTFRDPRRSEPLIYPHNLALNIWVEYGLAGLLAAGWLTLRAGRLTAAAFRRAPDGLRLGAIAALAAVLAHGVVDVPFFKNDLAVLTWLLFVLAFPPRKAPHKTSG